MSKKRRPHPRIKSEKGGADLESARLVSRKSLRLLLVLVAVFCAGGIAFWFFRVKGRETRGTSFGSVTHRSEHPTFSRDVAPILYSHCVVCHRAGESAPFELFEFSAARKHAKQIVAATGQRYMPPWLPTAGFGEFAHDRSLTADEIATLKEWYESGTPEGDRADLPRAPVFADDWRLGPPDLIVTLPDPFSVPAEGRDLYRNLVFPIPLDRSRFVRALEFHPGNPRVLHHAFVNLDETRSSRRLAARQTPPGFDGMEIPPPASMPGGQFLSWQPGRFPAISPPGLAWMLRTNTDMVLQMHLHPSGKAESIQPTVGFYFTDVAPTNTPFRLGLKSFELDIARGDSNYVVQESYTLPTDVSVLRIDTHAHYLAREMKAWAVPPGGQTNWLIWIKNWDFNWQGGYDYLHPISLPKGTVVSMRYVYDNSTNNVRNPSQPPHRVRFGIQTTDEMGELWLQVIAGSPADRTALARDYFAYLGRKTMSFDLFRLQLNPDDVDAHVRLANNLATRGDLRRAEDHLLRAIQIQPGHARAHHGMGDVYLQSNRIPDAAREFQKAAALDPYDSEAFGNLGYSLAQLGRVAEARQALREAVRINPDDTSAAEMLRKLGSR